MNRELLNDEIIRKLEKLVDGCVFSAGNITILKSNEYDNKLQQISKLQKERDKACKDYLDLYAKVENVKDMLKEFMIREKYKINNDKFTYIHLEQLGDFKMLLDELGVKNGN